MTLSYYCNTLTLKNLCFYSLYWLEFFHQDIHRLFQECFSFSKSNVVCSIYHFCAALTKNVAVRLGLLFTIKLTIFFLRRCFHFESTHSSSVSFTLANKCYSFIGQIAQILAEDHGVFEYLDYWWVIERLLYLFFNSLTVSSKTKTMVPKDLFYNLALFRISATPISAN